MSQADQSSIQIPAWTRIGSHRSGLLQQTVGSLILRDGWPRCFASSAPSLCSVNGRACDGKGKLCESKPEQGGEASVTVTIRLLLNDLRTTKVMSCSSTDDCGASTRKHAGSVRISPTEARKKSEDGAKLACCGCPVNGDKRGIASLRLSTPHSFIRST